MNKYILKAISIVMILLVLTGCRKRVPKADINELQSREGVMLKISSSCHHPYNWSPNGPIDRHEGDSYTIYWNGTVEKTAWYSISENIVLDGVSLSSEDYMYLYDFAEDAYLNDSFEGYREEICDGQTYSFMYYPADDDEPKDLYSGYCEDNEKLQGAINVVSKYFDPELTQKKETVATFESITLYNDTEDESYSICDGMISFNNGEPVPLSGEDNNTLYEYQQNVYYDDSFLDYVKGHYDFDGWEIKFTFSKKYGEIIYVGYPEDSEDLKKAIEIARSYFE